jgi:hypothetical protein
MPEEEEEFLLAKMERSSFSGSCEMPLITRPCTSASRICSTTDLWELDAGGSGPRTLTILLLTEILSLQEGEEEALQTLVLAVVVAEQALQVEVGEEEGV